jgi:hypothetical protein
MVGEIIGELIAGVAEIGIEAAGSSNNKKNGIGCLITTFLLILICVGVYFIATAERIQPTHGLVTKKLPNDKMVVRTKKGEDVYTITHELYLNKKEGDSIILK